MIIRPYDPTETLGVGILVGAAQLPQYCCCLFIYKFEELFVLRMDRQYSEHWWNAVLDGASRDLFQTKVSDHFLVICYEISAMTIIEDYDELSLSSLITQMAKPYTVWRK